jgi:hypothetical protein
LLLLSAGGGQPLQIKRVEVDRIEVKGGI